MGQSYFLPHSEWFRPYVAGYFAFTVLGLDLSREEVMARLDELLLVGQPWLGGVAGAEGESAPSLIPANLNA